ncbi:peptidase MA family metallohydrolase [Methanocella conradii]|uniref:peptidase MA family metallohydrolase n=1 Tax=Methanocella conradii TaxID=1175444 RepID=UPI00157D3F59|nr:peptidase MA family metallohydrolase [Methanocella conradii]
MRSLTGRLCSISLALIIVITALFPMVGAGASTEFVPRPPGDFYLNKDDPHFNVYYDSTMVADIGSVVISADAAYDTVAAFFGPYDYKVNIILASDHDQYVSIITLNLPNSRNIPEDEDSSNWGYGEQGTIVIEMPDRIENITDALKHELTHIVIRTRLINNGYALPEWFSEGMAIYVSGGLSNDSMAMLEGAARNDRLLTISQMEDALKHPIDPVLGEKDLSMSRAQSGMLIKYIVEKYGKESVKQILQDFAANSDLDKAFLSQIGCTPDEINAGMMANLKAELIARDRQETAQRVYGYVAGRDGEPIEGQTILFTSMSNGSASFGKVYRAVTDKFGYYDVNLTYGSFTVHVEGLNGYQPFDSNITLAKNEVRLYNITLGMEKLVSHDFSASNKAAGDGIIYALLAVLNLAAILLIAIVFWRVRK